MKILGKLILTSLLLVVSLIANAIVIPFPSSLNNASQLILVIAPNLDSAAAYLQLFQRGSEEQAWQPVGNPMPAVVGKHGMAWGLNLEKYGLAGPDKHEGDFKTPAGVYSLGPAFGFANASGPSIKMPYIGLNQYTVCVDDTKSEYYNQIIDSNRVNYHDWHSGEQMRQVPNYKWGLNIHYNTEKPVPGDGSCIFFHIWTAPTVGTSGCVAASEENVKKVLVWLNPKDHPHIVILPADQYKTFQAAWHLPALKQ